jgi:Family of unknown function (DUF6476)
MPLRALKILVVVMGVMLVVGFAALIVAITNKVSQRRPEPPAGRQITATAIEIPRGARVEAMTTAPDRLILDLVLPDGSRQIVLIDLATGVRVGLINLRAAPSTSGPAAAGPAEAR